MVLRNAQTVLVCTSLCFQGNTDISIQQAIKIISHPHQLRPHLPSIESDKSLVAIASLMFWVGGGELGLSGI